MDGGARHGASAPGGSTHRRAHVSRAFILGRDEHRGRARAPAAVLPAAGIAIRSLDARHDRPSIGGARGTSLRWINSIDVAYFERDFAA
ncbi:hypothetical protein WS69_04015 [Burkholderia sp. BDU5]|nr:hypothetical protein WS69_04015 [Burkholderia sp. BDU5]